MNQILSMNGGFDNPNGNNMNPFGNGKEKKPKKGPLETKTTVLIFAIVLVVFGIALLGVGIGNLIGSLNGNAETESEWPKFEAELQDDNTLYVIVSHDQIIDKIVYYWDGGFEQEISGNNEKNATVTLKVPVGRHILTLTSIDINGKEKVYQSAFNGVALEAEPEIEMTIMHSKLNVVAKSTTETKIAYLTYKWNNDKETRIEATYDEAMIETQIEIPKGKNTITITAVKENGVSSTRTQAFDGVEKPTINVVLDGNRLRVTIEHENGISAVKCTCNDRNVSISPDKLGPDKKTVTFAVKYIPGQVNVLNIEATSYDGATAAYVKEF